MTREICQSGSERGAKPTFVPTPIATPKEPSRRVRCDSCRCAHRFDDWSDEISNRKTKTKTETETRRTCGREIALGLAAPDHTVPYGTVLWRDASQALRARLRSVLSLRDELADILQQHPAKAYRECPGGTVRSIIPDPTGRFVPGTLSQALRARLRSCCPYGTRWQTFRNRL